MGMESKYLTIGEVATLTSLARTTIHSHRACDTAKSPLPQPAKRYGNLQLWLRTDIEQWIATRDARPGPPKHDPQT